VICQAAVDGIYSGALAMSDSGELIVEGVKGRGDEFMLGDARPCTVSKGVREDVEDLYRASEPRLGPTRMEWVHDGRRVWVVQLHVGTIGSTSDIIVPGGASSWLEFNVERGLPALREEIRRAQDRDMGISLIGQVGITSHMGDLLRKSRIPSRIERKSWNSKVAGRQLKFFS
jgi:hypothetical protein